MIRRNLICRLAVAAALALLVGLQAAPAAAATPAPIDRVPAGMDLWQTLGAGATHYTFANHPIPAGFFCEGSEPFTGSLRFEGVPLKTLPERALGTTDTIIERLDDAVYDGRGVATAHIQARALSLHASTPIHNSCGDWEVFASLEGEQPVTTMRLRRTSALGGVFDADLKLQVKLTFRHLKGGVTRELVQQIDMPTTTSSVFFCASFDRVGMVNTISSALQAVGDVEVFAPVTRNEKSVPVHAVTVKATSGSGCVTGTQCDPNNPSHCMYVYSWHSPAANESHFVSTPCQLGYTQFCSNPPPTLDESKRGTASALPAAPGAGTVSQGLLVQLRELRRLGIIDRPAEEVLQMQANPGGAKN